jgi:hypothetical protein
VQGARRPKARGAKVIRPFGALPWLFYAALAVAFVYATAAGL